MLLVITRRLAFICFAVATTRALPMVPWLCAIAVFEVVSILLSLAVRYHKKYGRVR
jgi:hypothetical protein